MDFPKRANVSKHRSAVFTCLNKSKSAMSWSFHSPPKGSLPNMGHLLLINVRTGSKQATEIWQFPNETYSWFIQRCVKEELGRTVPKKKKRCVGGRIWKECRRNEHFNVRLNKSTASRGGGKGSVGNLLTQASGWRQNHPAEQWASVCCLYLSLFLQLQLLPIQVHTEVGYSLDNTLCAYLQPRFERGPCWQLSPLPLISAHIIHFSPLQHLSFSLCSPTSHPFVYWFSRLRIPWVEDCNTQASNYFGGELICLSLASIWPVSVDNYAFPGPDSGANNEGQIESYV